MHRGPVVSARAVSSRVRFVVALLGIAAGCALVVPQVRPGPALADQMDDAATALRELVASGEDSKVVVRIKELERARDERIDDALLAAAKSPRLESASVEAMRVLGIHRSPAYVKWVRTRLCDERMAEKETRRFLAMLESLPPTGDALRPALPDLARCVREFFKKRGDVATRAVAAYASIAGDKAVVEGLFDLLGDVEKAKPSSGGGGRGRNIDPMEGSGSGSGSGSGPVSGVEPTREAIHRALESLTGGTAGSASAWRVWWATHENDFKVIAPEPDWGALAHFDDVVLGFVVKKPAAEGAWTFERSTFNGGRARLRLGGLTRSLAVLDIVTYPKGTTPDVAVFAQNLADTWQSGNFTEFSDGGAPSVKPRSMAGRPFSVATASGTGSGAWAEWDALERRAYVTTAADGSFLVFEGATRNDLDEPTRRAFWAAIESVTFRKVR